MSKKLNAKKVESFPDKPEGKKRNSIRKFFRDNWILIFVALYVISPIDILPEGLLGVFGLPDDIGLILAAIYNNYKSK